MKKVFIGLSLLICACACNNHNAQSDEDETRVEKQVEIVETGLLMKSDKALTPKQKELKAQIYHVLLEYVEVDTIANHLQLTLTKQEFKEKGLDESLYRKCLSEIDDVNTYADKTGKGQEMMKSWMESKEHYLKQSAGK